MRCDEAQETLWSPMEPEDGAASGAEQGATRGRDARSHVARCSRCRAFLARDRALSRRLGWLRRDARASRSLRRRVLAALEAERGPRVGSVQRPAGRRALAGRISRSLGLPAAAAAALALGLAVGSPRETSFAHPTWPAHFANDYLRLAVQEEAAAALDSGSIASFFLRELGRDLAPVDVPGAVLTRAIVCLLDGRRGAMVEYDLAGARLAHYRIPLSGGGPGAASPEMSVEMGLPVARWTDGEYEHALLGELSAAELRRLARERFADR